MGHYIWKNCLDILGRGIKNDLTWFFNFCNCIFQAEPEPPIKLEKMEETTNKISLALEIPEEATKSKSGR